MQLLCEQPTGLAPLAGKLYCALAHLLAACRRILKFVNKSTSDVQAVRGVASPIITDDCHAKVYTGMTINFACLLYRTACVDCMR